MMVLIRYLRALKFTWIYVVFAISTANTGLWVTGAVTTRTLVLAAHINVPVKCLRSLYQWMDSYKSISYISVFTFIFSFLLRKFTWKKWSASIYAQITIFQNYMLKNWNYDALSHFCSQRVQLVKYLLTSIYDTCTYNESNNVTTLEFAII